MPVSCAGYLTDFSGVCFNLALISSGVSLVSTWHFLAGFLSRSDPVDLTFLISFWTPLVLGTVFPVNLLMKFSPTLSSRTTFHMIHTEEHAVQQYTKPFEDTQ
jgi:hypothetical protein